MLQEESERQRDECEKQGLNNVSQLIKSLEKEWKTVMILIGFKGWKRVMILIGFKGWKSEAWSGVSGKDMLTEFVECRSREKVRERS